AATDRARAAAAALDRATALLTGADRAPDRAPDREATLVLRDLALQRAALTGADRTAADALLARPTAAEGGAHLGAPAARTWAPPLCGPNVCVHYALDTDDAPDLTDGPDEGTTPDYVDAVLATLEQVHATYVAAGYRPPKSDGTNGGDPRTDIYLADVGALGLYGFCTSDQQPIGPPWDVWAYCLLDNDYAPDEFPTNTPLENMQVTAAHEYFHAVQFAYDIGEDTWFMEGTATWAEDELFDDVDDSAFYLRYGQLGDPGPGPSYAGPATSLDAGRGLNVYGNWVFFRYLTERFPAEAGGLPTLVRSMWRNADAAPGAKDRYSLQAVRRALAGAGADLGTVYADFADANRRPGRVYEEGGSHPYPRPPLARRATLTRNQRVAERRVDLDHLTSATVRFRPGSGLAARGWRLRLVLDLPHRGRGSHAVVTSYDRDGDVTTRRVKLDRTGAGAVSVPFGSRRVRHVEVTLVNASTRTTRCWSDERLTYSCGGVPRDDGLRARVRGTARQ
ncbi:MXAN_6640 family putative metalloprotease, partial [Nocardioides sp. GCM10027114]